MSRTPPSKIYLQFYGADKFDLKAWAFWEKPEPAEEITWCQDRIFDTDIEYVRASRTKRKKRSTKTTQDFSKEQHK